MEQINISQLCTKIIQHTIKNTGEKVEFKVSDKLFVRGDFVLVRLAFENLIHNAVKFSIPGKKNIINIGKEVRGDKTYIYIKDKGMGFNEAYLNKIFKPFEKLNPDDRFESYGIGLAKVQRIVSKHGGDVFAESIEGEGAVFYINFG